MVHSDVKSVNALGRHGVKFDMRTLTEDKFIVSRVRDLGGIPESASVVFELNRLFIDVRQNADKVIFSARPIMNPDGECLLDTGDRDAMGESHLRTEWQVSRRALEDLFFGF